MPGMGPRAKFMEGCQPGLASTLAAAISLDEPPQQWESGYAFIKQKLITGNLLKLHTSVEQDVIRAVQKLHRNLGHPAPRSWKSCLLLVEPVTKFLKKQKPMFVLLTPSTRNQ